MRHFVSLVILCGVAVGFGAPPPAGGGAFPVLVNAAWLGEHASDPSLLIVHVAANRREYIRGHIPGARFLWSQALAYSNEDYTLEVPSIERADSVLSALGVSGETHIILCFAAGNVTPATRVFMTLDYLGLAGRVSLLDGGLEAWRAVGKPVATDIPAGLQGEWHSHAEPGVIVNGDWVASHLADSTVALVDARAPQFYGGHGGGMPRPGHIPGAVNMPFNSLVDSTNRMKSPDALRALFLASGVTPAKTVVSYCHIGQQASLVYFAARYLGFPARLYDGSFEDWSGRDDVPVVNTAENRETPKR